MSGLSVGMTRRPLPRSPEQLNPLVLAYVGDAVYELYVRYHLLTEGIAKPQELQQAAVRYVSAGAQAAAFRDWEPILTEEELAVWRRGRNVKSGRVPRRASVSQYRASTGLEALVGYWYLTGQIGRLTEMMERMFQITRSDVDDSSD
jgi:ribonuclease-3 family protein